MPPTTLHAVVVGLEARATAQRAYRAHTNAEPETAVDLFEAAADAALSGEGEMLYLARAAHCADAASLFERAGELTQRALARLPENPEFSSHLMQILRGPSQPAH